MSNETSPTHEQVATLKAHLERVRHTYEINGGERDVQ